MTRLLFAPLVLLALAFPAAAQTSPATPEDDGTIILKQDADHPQTVIQIEGGVVTVNGDTVSTDGARGRRRIIVDAPENGGFPTEEDMAAAAPNVVRQTILGALTQDAFSGDGAVVQEVMANTPAQKSGLQEGDKILRVDAIIITGSQHLQEIIRRHQPGDKVTITYERAGKRRTAQATLAASAPGALQPRSPMGDSRGGMPNPFELPNDGTDPMAGLDLSELFKGFGLGGSSSSAPKLGLQVEDRTEGKGVVVNGVTEGSPAEVAGLKKGDILTHVDGEEIRSVDDLTVSVRSHLPGDSFDLKYTRGGKAFSAQATLPKATKKGSL